MLMNLPKFLDMMNRMVHAIILLFCEIQIKLHKYANEFFFYFEISSTNNSRNSRLKNTYFNKSLIQALCHAHLPMQTIFFPISTMLVFKVLSQILIKMNIAFTFNQFDIRNILKLSWKNSSTK